MVLLAHDEHLPGSCGNDLDGAVPIQVPYVHSDDTAVKRLAPPDSGLSEGTFGSDLDEVGIDVGNSVPHRDSPGNQEFGVPVGEIVGGGCLDLSLLSRPGEDLSVDVLGEQVDLGNHIIQGPGLGSEDHGFALSRNGGHSCIDTDGLANGGDTAIEDIVRLKRSADTHGIFRSHVTFKATDSLVRGGPLHDGDLTLPGKARGEHVPNTILEILEVGRCVHGKRQNGNLRGLRIAPGGR
jgi:hypothetical protein